MGGCLRGVLLTLMLAFLVASACSGCRVYQYRSNCNQDWDWDQEEARCERMYRGVLAHWAEHGAFPSSFGKLGLQAPPEGAAPWTYAVELNHFAIGLGDYDLCDWEISREFGWWYEPRIAPPPELGREAVLLLRLTMKHYLEHDGWPASLEELGLNPDWGVHGPWLLDPPVADDPLDTTQTGAVRQLQSSAPFAVHFYWMPEWYYNT